MHREPGWCASSCTLERYQEKDKERARGSERAKPKKRGLTGSVEGTREKKRETGR